MARAKTVWGYIEKRDHRVMRRMNQWKAPRWIRFWMLAATRMGDGWIWYSLAAILLLGGGANRYAAVGAAGVMGGASLSSSARADCAWGPSGWAARNARHPSVDFVRSAIR